MASVVSGRRVDCTHAGCETVRVGPPMDASSDAWVVVDTACRFCGRVRDSWSMGGLVQPSASGYGDLGVHVERTVAREVRRRLRELGVSF